MDDWSDHPAEERRQRVNAQFAAMIGLEACPTCGVIYWHWIDAEYVEIDGCDCTP